MTREPNPYAKDPTLTTNQAMVMAVPSVIAEDVLNGPDVVNAQHQKNTDIHVSDADREKWDKTYDTHMSDTSYTCEEDENTIDVSASMFMLLISYMADPTMKSYTEVTLHFSKSAEPDMYGTPWGSDEPVYLCLAMLGGGLGGVSTNAILPAPGGVGTFKFAAPIADGAIGMFCTDPSNPEETMKTIGLRISPSNTYANGVVIGDIDQYSEIAGSIILSVRNEYIHAKDASLHVGEEITKKLQYIAVQDYKSQDSISAVVEGSGSVALGTHSQASNSNGYATALGSDSLAEGYASVAIGLNSRARARSTIAFPGCYVDAAYSKALGSNITVHSEDVTAVGFSHTVADPGVLTLGAGWTDDKWKNYRTILYLISAGSDLANQYEDGAAALGYVVRDASGNITKCGTRKLSELLTNNTAFAPATLDLDSDPPTPFLPTGITEPWDEPEQVEVTEEPQKEANTPVEQLKAKLAEFAKTIRS